VVQDSKNTVPANRSTIMSLVCIRLFFRFY
jgi:hypothetical protein